jgi:hypothetical protein
VTNDIDAAASTTTVRPSRRTVLMGAAGVTAFWAVPTIASFTSPAAAASGQATSGLFKATSGNTPLPANICTAGAGSSVNRGSVTLTRSENPATISISITLSTGQTATGRSILVLQANANGCLVNVADPAAAVGTWAATPAQGPQVFSAPIASGADRFVVVMVASGGGGNDDTASNVVILP